MVPRHLLTAVLTVFTLQSVVLTSKLSGGPFLVFTPDGSRCLNCADPGVAAEVGRVLSFRGQRDVLTWFREHWRVADDLDGQIATATGRLHTTHDFVPDYPGGWTFSAPGIQLLYRTDACKVFDCYKHYLSRVDGANHHQWRRHVPWMRVLVFPFITPVGLLYVGGKPAPEGDVLVIVDPETGRLLGEVPIPAGKCRIGLTNPVESYPFYRDGFVVVQGFDTTRDYSTGSRDMDKMPCEILALDLRPSHQ